MEHQEQYMRRCFDLARLGAGYVAPNPMVGAVVVYQGRIIGEGYHQRHGAAHAEVNAIDQVSDKDRALLRSATLYVSLEPCCFHGNTPPCTALIIRHQIPRVVISCLDESPQVSGKGVQQLRAAGCEVITGILESEGRQLSAIRNTFVTQQRPYILLKYAQSADGFIGQSDRQV
ncbi:MAG: bifunctional diaminohydroxyphosphoribosylaminopyrimidine deaminase/5-amino-6-(5-phosphoribosylamino)uracil reductase RibD, partial [Bacteroidota bacterium]